MGRGVERVRHKGLCIEVQVLAAVTWRHGFCRFWRVSPQALLLLLTASWLQPHCYVAKPPSCCNSLYTCHGFSMFCCQFFICSASYFFLNPAANPNPPIWCMQGCRTKGVESHTGRNNTCSPRRKSKGPRGRHNSIIHQQQGQRTEQRRPQLLCSRRRCGHSASCNCMGQPVCLPR